MTFKIPVYQQIAGTCLVIEGLVSLYFQVGDGKGSAPCPYHRSEHLLARSALNTKPSGYISCTRPPKGNR